MQLQTVGNYHSDWTKPRLIREVLACLEPGTQIGNGSINPNVAQKLLGNLDFLKHLTNSGCDMVMAMLGRQHSGNNDAKIHTILQHIDINVTVKVGDHSISLVITRAMNMEQFHAKVSNAMHDVVVAGMTTPETVDQRAMCRTTLGTLGVNDQSVIQMLLQPQYQPAPTPLPRRDNLEEAQLASAILESQLQDSSACLSND